ncbi:hypothetical protein BDZ94DRAFT_1164039 [Collybia nuda]|uniref:Chromo domain-containing protein n=1 Tax=Collybia nuda TaxID=64659 RepID=A0A9P5Y6Y7_9AGAR|nr:hypothetical protein BDZ94DRAFT_1164039 [Collybia nuda]
MPATRTTRSTSGGFSLKTRRASDLIHLDQDDDEEPLLVSASAPRPCYQLTGTSTENVTSIPKAKGHQGLKLSHPVSQTSPGPIIVKGIHLKPTVVFDTFWRFAAERKAIDDRRRLGLPSPWTDDVFMRKYAFCNTYRVLDKVSQYIIREVIEKGPQEPQEVVFRIALFNMFTKIDTWELLDNELGPLTWERYDRDAYRKVLTKAKKQGMTLYTGAFQKPAPHFGFHDAHSNHLCLLEILMEADLPRRFSGARYMDEVYEYLVSFPSMGAFSTFQLMLNLSYSEVLNFSDMDFVVAGPGAHSGLTKMFGLSMKCARDRVHGIEINVIRWLAQHQDEHFQRLGLDFQGLGPDRLPMSLADIEHLLCEVDKYSRLAHPHIKSKRTELRVLFKPSSGNHPPNPTLPKAWSHSARKTIRIRPGGPPVIEKRYTVNHIGAHRDGPNGMEYHVFWTGYSDAEATWEPEALLLADAPVVVKEYLAKQSEEI